MNVIVAGSRTITDRIFIEDNLNALSCEFEFTKVITGGCKGVDTLAHEWAKRREIKTEIYWPEWDKYGKAAGPMRNRIMALQGDILIAFWDNYSRGTKNMMDQAGYLGLLVFDIQRTVRWMMIKRNNELIGKYLWGNEEDSEKIKIFLCILEMNKLDRRTKRDNIQRTL